MYRKIIDIINYFLNTCDSDCNPANTYMEVELTENEDFLTTIKVTFVAPWAKHFNISSSFSKLLGQNKISMIVHHGDCVEGIYNLYKLTLGENEVVDVTLDAEDEAFIKECEYYVSLIIDTQRQSNIFVPKLQNFIENAKKNRGITMTYSESIDLKKSCVNIIGKALENVLQYSVSEKRKNILQLLNANMTDEAVEKLKKFAEETLKKNSVY